MQGKFYSENSVSFDSKYLTFGLLVFFLQKSNTDPKFICEICNVDIGREDVFNEHKRLHEGLPPNQCVYCNSQPKTALALKYHIGKHVKRILKIENYQCEFCGLTFITKSAVNSHRLNVHTAERTYECDICGQKFKMRSHIVRHLTTHVIDFVYT